ncbi:MAG: 2-oxoglutarate dehydrogenase complex dihydrolipoyllysine-residue succinyltransferase [Bacteroidales bacterium]|nr:2-oxoglutarate dehydrogenase complex dihydrolipoyllysine-residue succinyltransferase [Bacteroidales bacterium]MBN2750252.1 2-oxoglutarate dehydrogenase complex dihydrolipoyllysine-residue succinyltransferase [Bacteroidales bacterium]
MVHEITIPSPGESITEVEIARWLVENGAYVEKDQELAEIESDKATLPLLAVEAGAISIIAPEGQPVKVGTVACTINSDAAPQLSAPKKEEQKAADEPQKEAPQHKNISINKPTNSQQVKATPLAKAIMEDSNLSVDDIIKGLRKLTSQDVERAKQALLAPTEAMQPTPDRTESSERMSPLRKKISQRLVAVKNETAMLTTFNEVDMSNVLNIRKKYQPLFVEKYGIKLGLMSFFVKATVEALKAHPSVRSRIQAEEIVTPNYFDIGIAVQTPKGLMVPVLRDADKLSLAEIEKGIANLATKGRSGRITVDELNGGVFTITNGGVFGSMLSTPIINPPQSGILGMHNIVERPVAIDGKVEVRPIMYVALSYDHRIIDGKDSVGFLVKVKELIENPELMLLGGNNPYKMLLQI